MRSRRMARAMIKVPWLRAGVWQSRGQQRPPVLRDVIPKPRQIGGLARHGLLRGLLEGSDRLAIGCEPVLLQRLLDCAVEGTDL